jgi:hypothetical protein
VPLVIREAELFVMAEQVLVEVLGRIRVEDRAIVIPPLFDVPGADRPLPLRQVVERYARETARVPDLLAGRRTEEAGSGSEADLLGDDPQAVVVRLSDAACAAARRVTDGDATVHADDGDVPVRDYLSRLTIARAFVAHDVAIHLGSRACPLTEELARGLWEGTAPVAERWRALGIFREPLPMPDDVSWRDRFLLSAGRDPHPLHH